MFERIIGPPSCEVWIHKPSEDPQCISTNYVKIPTGFLCRYNRIHDRTNKLQIPGMCWGPPPNITQGSFQIMRLQKGDDIPGPAIIFQSTGAKLLQWSHQQDNKNPQCTRLPSACMGSLATTRLPLTKKWKLAAELKKIVTPSFQTVVILLRRWLDT